jgi:hypothetical protein
VDKKGLSIFIVVLAGLCLAVQALYTFPGILGTFGLRAPGFPFTLPLLWVPALAAFLAAGLTGDTVNPRLRVWPLPWKPVLAAVVVIPLVFAAIGAVEVLTGYATLDLGAPTLLASMPLESGALQWGAGQRLAFVCLGLVLTLVLGPTLFALLWLGGEIGWRDYLLPKLLPLGRVPAYLVSGLAWGMWMAWLGFLPQESAASWPVASYALWGIVIGTILNEIWRRGRRVGLAAVALGVYFSQAAGIWSYILPWKADSPLLGETGFLSIGAWAVVAAALFFWPYRESSGD